MCFSVRKLVLFQKIKKPFQIHGLTVGKNAYLLSFQKLDQKIMTKMMISYNM